MRNNIWIGLIGLGIFLVSFSGYAYQDSTTSDQARISHKLLPRFPIKIDAIIETGLSASGNLTSGTFDSERATYYNSLALLPSYVFFKRENRSFLRSLALKSRLDLDFYYNGGDETKREFDISNLYLQLQSPTIFHETKTNIDVNAAIRCYLPTSRTSAIGGYYNPFYTHVATQLGLSRPWALGLKYLNSIRPSYNLTFTKFFFVNQIVLAAPHAPNGDGYVSAMPEKYQMLGYYNLNYRLTHELGLNLNFTANLSLSLYLLIYNSFAYGPSQPTERYAGQDISGNRRDAVWGIAEISYQALPWLSFSLGTSNLGPQRSESQSFINPFYDNRFLTYYFDIGISI